MRFISVTKPGIIFGNIITMSGGFFLGSQGHFNVWLYLATLIGMALVIACGCVFNNIIDRDIDRLMERTKNRVLVQGLMSLPVAIFYGAALGLLGVLMLYFLANPLTAGIALFGLLIYVLVYSLYAKRKSYFCTEIGAIAGAIPPVVGYCAVMNVFDLGAILVFLILFCWQMPHSYAIAIYRIKDYQAAKLPVLPLSKTVHFAKVSSLLYVTAFLVAAITPTLFGHAGKLYFFAALVIGIYWVYITLQSFKAKDDHTWARKMFKVSVINITILSFMMAVG